MESINPNRPNIGGRVSTLPSEIDRIMAKIDQDNRVLAELDKTRSTIGNNDLGSVKKTSHAHFFLCLSYAQHSKNTFAYTFCK